PTTAWAMAARSSPRRSSCAWMRDSSWGWFMASGVRSFGMRVAAGAEEGRGRSCAQRVDDDVHRELRVVLGQEALVAPVVVPFAAVVLVAVEHAQATVHLDALEVVVDEVVAPAVELVAGRG